LAWGNRPINGSQGVQSVKKVGEEGQFGWGCCIDRKKANSDKRSQRPPRKGGENNIRGGEERGRHTRNG